MPTPNLNLPEPDYERDINRYIRVYKVAISEIITRIQTLSTWGKNIEVNRSQMESLLSQITFILRQMDGETQKWVEETIRKAFTDGQARTILALGEAKTLSEAASLVAFSMLSRDTVEALIADTFQDLLLATQNTERKVKQLVRDVVAEQMRAKAIEQMGRNTTRTAIVETLTKKGLSEKFNAEAFVSIVDKKGRRWKLDVYSDMVVRTKLTQAHVEGSRVEALERGVDLAIISDHNSDDACGRFEGMVISMNGLTPGFPTYAELRRSNLIFHPNCKHKVTPIRDVSLLPEAVRRKFESKREAAESALKKALNK